MKTWTFPAALCLTLVACQGSTQTAAPNTPPSTPTPVAIEPDTGVAPAPAVEPTPAAPTPVEVAPPAPPPLVGLRTLTLRPGAPPPVGAYAAHGATVWAVTLAASAGPSPELTALFAQTQAAHLAASVGDLGCTPAVGEAYPGTIPNGEGAQIVTVTFRSERDARRFAAALTEAPLRTGRVRVMCAD